MPSYTFNHIHHETKGHQRNRSRSHSKKIMFGHAFFAASSFFADANAIQPGDFLKFRELSLSYSFKNIQKGVSEFSCIFSICKYSMVILGSASILLSQASRIISILQLFFCPNPIFNPENYYPYIRILPSRGEGGRVVAALYILLKITFETIAVELRKNA